MSELPPCPSCGRAFPKPVRLADHLACPECFRPLPAGAWEAPTPNPSAAATHAQGLLSRLQRLGVELSVAGGRLHIHAPRGALDPEDRKLLARHRRALATLIAGERQAPPGPAQTPPPGDGPPQATPTKPALSAEAQVGLVTWLAEMDGAEPRSGSGHQPTASGNQPLLPGHSSPGPTTAVTAQGNSAAPPAQPAAPSDRPHDELLRQLDEKMKLGVSLPAEDYDLPIDCGHCGHTFRVRHEVYRAWREGVIGMLNCPSCQSPFQQGKFGTVQCRTCGARSGEMPQSVCARLDATEAGWRCQACLGKHVGQLQTSRPPVVGASPTVTSQAGSASSVPSLLPKGPSPQVAPERRYNVLAMIGFILGIAAVFLYFLGIIPLLGILFSIIGVGTFDEKTQKGMWMAWWGLGLSAVYTLVYLNHYGYLR